MFNINTLLEETQQHELFKKDDVIFADGEASNGKMYVLLSGTVGVYKNYGKSGQICIATLDPGAFFGEMALFLDMERAATIVADEDVILYMFDKSATLDFINSHPETTFAFIQALCNKIKVSNSTSAAVSDENFEAKTLASKDPLTGMYNRRYFMETAAYLTNTAEIRDEKFYIAIFDLDYFKKVNDTYGHQAGDHVLKEFSALLSDTLRSDDIFARYGGEEFILFASCNNAFDAMIFIDRLRAMVKDMKITFEGTSIPVTTSIGVSHVDLENEVDVESAIALSDMALYEAKKRGRNQTVFYEKGMGM